ncbi:dihydroorotate dehydrogenase electron transfer subunit [Methanosphaera sp. WGK6]|uniref:dihydroorotate dehydrogenase electron transfer subunit n=1 Tax=Methanosphaera sp. WGK6 TaxID=1561964 RepID=UPI00084CB5D8|nr:dihydroorotate dehydrogenase electron transfer subunit [Methanosphaera sp. WGK6]OED29958.1 dihydroorotate dehydrogenase [Methanosphaera sp. WGK6]
MINNIYDDEVPQVVTIKETIIETPTVKTIIFPWKITDDIHPGQFIMVWDLNTEKPMTISIIDKENNLMGITVRKAGPFTTNIYDNINKGDKIGIRGPYGHGYDLKKYKKILAVGGGSGIASLAPLTSFYDNIELISAASTKDELVFVDRFKNSDIDVYECTDDGTCGFKGFSTELAEDLINKGDYDIIIGCGPEIMSYKLYELSLKYNIDCQFALDRFMKCGLGICGQCCMDDTGVRVCVEGPVFDKEQLSQLSEFGKYRRDASGSIVK